MIKYLGFKNDEHIFEGISKVYYVFDNKRVLDQNDLKLLATMFEKRGINGGIPNVLSIKKYPTSLYITGACGYERRVY